METKRIQVAAPAASIFNGARKLGIGFVVIAVPRAFLSILPDPAAPVIFTVSPEPPAAPLRIAL